jgi:hypothetical protein
MQPIAFHDIHEQSPAQIPTLPRKLNSLSIANYSP